MLCSPRCQPLADRGARAARLNTRRNGSIVRGARALRAGGAQGRAHVDDLYDGQLRIRHAVRQREQRVLARLRVAAQLSRLGVALPSTTTAPSARARTMRHLARVIARRLACL